MLRDTHAHTALVFTGGGLNDDGGEGRPIQCAPQAGRLAGELLDDDVE